MHTKVISATTIGIDAFLVDVEVDLSLGMLQFFIVGLPDTAIKESKQRIIPALKNCGVTLPERKITVNLAPADLKKEGTLFDLPIALGIMQAAHILEPKKEILDSTIFIGELSLDGSIKPVRGVLSIACDAKKLGKTRLVVPLENAREAALAPDIEVIGVSNLVELVEYLRGERDIKPTQNTLNSYLEENIKQRAYAIDFSQVTGQYQAKRALQIAAAGRHNILFIGSPGSGKSMLAQRISTIMPPLNFEEIIEATKIYSISGVLDRKKLTTDRPFRNPHHTISQAGLVGGGSHPQPGEISLAHHGILFLDELTEFKKTALEALREPLETQSITISRAQQSITFPAHFLFIAALNPCPCGYFGDKRKKCTCLPHQVKQYMNKISGPLLDRIDLQVYVPSVEYKTIAKKTREQTSAELYVPIERALQKQKERFGTSTRYNNTMSQEHINTCCALNGPTELLMKRAFEQLNLSMRSYHKVLKVARTIADLENSDNIQETHLHEALSYRSMDQAHDQEQN